MSDKTAILYSRFSPRPNAAECESVEKQLEDLNRYCKDNNLKVAGEFSDKALSGADQDRPGMWDAIHALKPGYILVVRSFDRLARDSAFALHIIKHEIEKKKATILSITEPGASEDTPDGRLVRSLMLAIAEYQRELIRAKTRAAMKRYQKEGRRMSKECPYGMKDDPKDSRLMVKNEKEAEVIDTVIYYHKAGLPLRKIALLLAERGYQNRKGKAWHHNQVSRILDRAGVRLDDKTTLTMEA